jgi:8-oxo-dGTP pyrophosphatase MutT (NUDIX family)
MFPFVLASYDMTTLATRLRARGAPDADVATTDKEAAVAAILRARDGADAEILLIRRAVNPGDPWSGHMAFPGGRRDPDDASLLATAIRETREEVGLDLAIHGDVLARLPDVAAIAKGKRIGMNIAAFVFALRHEGEALLAPNDEVAETVWAPLGPLARGERAGVYPYRYEGIDLELPSIDVGGRIVWGLTHKMLSALFDKVHA